MLVPFTVWALAVLTAIFTRYFGSGDRLIVQGIVYLFFVPLALTARPESSGIDVSTYINSITGKRTYEFAENGWLILEKLIFAISSDAIVVEFILAGCAMIPLVAVYQQMSRKRAADYLALFVATHAFWQVMWNLIRQGITVSLILLSVSLWHRYRLFSALLAASSLGLHSAAPIFLGIGMLAYYLHTNISSIRIISLLCLSFTAINFATSVSFNFNGLLFLTSEILPGESWDKFEWYLELGKRDSYSDSELDHRNILFLIFSFYAIVRAARIRTWSKPEKLTLAIGLISFCLAEALFSNNIIIYDRIILIGQITSPITLVAIFRSERLPDYSIIGLSSLFALFTLVFWGPRNFL